MAYVFITEVQDVLHHISDRVEDDSGEKTDECRKLIAELELMLQKEIKEFEVIHMHMPFNDALSLVNN